VTFINAHENKCYIEEGKEIQSWTAFPRASLLRMTGMSTIPKASSPEVAFTEAFYFNAAGKNHKQQKINLNHNFTSHHESDSNKVPPPQSFQTCTGIQEPSSSFLSHPSCPHFSPDKGESHCWVCLSLRASNQVQVEGYFEF
jgi:hypothetical protein